ncbi:hypothetical protein M378DRAFT_15879 [Amanita muscaria Koide BX008]|uniref:Zona occludens toxin N-terminal domain-containing protein n=1 Tax=Amanita muscaria (strain Koide BX008) TaxID=946122 RepID=A0A0C2WP13_AMAMK|nr:hypothetical protein M378DRAFT_15879 [Amanita muscaria Koide BX008]
MATRAAATQDVRELELLHDTSSLEFRGRSIDQELCTAPILTRDAYVSIGQGETIQQYGVLGSIIEIGSKEEKETPPDPRLYLNTNAPLSAVICGVQGSGKSHSVSVMLENMLVPNYTRIGTLAQPLAGLVLHFGEGALPSEAASIGIRENEVESIQSPEVHVYVPKSSLKSRKQAYARVGPEIKVMPLLFDESELDAEAFLKMMAVGSLESAPLYMQIVMAILRELGEDFTLDKFQSELNKRSKSFNPAQLAPLEQRMALLTSFLARVAQQKRFSAGRLTIIDLSDPFIDSNSACNIFEIVVRSFVRAEVNTGKVLLVDEAHKYLSISDGSTGLTKSLLTLIREQRHFAMRVLVSTQEPTVIPPVILDLCSIMILHRFSSPRWWNHVVQHITAEMPPDIAFDKVSGLQTGEAIVLSPSGLTMVDNGQNLGRFGRRYIVMKSRKRVTRDSGTSVLVV